MMLAAVRSLRSTSDDRGRGRRFSVWKAVSPRNGLGPAEGGSGFQLSGKSPPSLLRRGPSAGLLQRWEEGGAPETAGSRAVRSREEQPSPPNTVFLRVENTPESVTPPEPCPRTNHLMRPFCGTWMAFWPLPSPAQGEPHIGPYLGPLTRLSLIRESRSVSSSMSSLPSMRNLTGGFWVPSATVMNSWSPTTR